VDLNAIGNTVVGLVIATAQEHINQKVDEWADQLVASVKSSETKIDDTVATAIAAAAERLAARVRAGLAAA